MKTEMIAIIARAVLLSTYFVTKYTSSAPPATTGARKKLMALIVAAAFLSKRNSGLSRNFSVPNLALVLNVYQVSSERWPRHYSSLGQMQATCQPRPEEVHCDIDLFPTKRTDSGVALDLRDTQSPCRDLSPPCAGTNRCSDHLARRSDDAESHGRSVHMHQVWPAQTRRTSDGHAQSTSASVRRA